jgi:glycosyltransferase involved in cell wall biosynthesis
MPKCSVIMPAYNCGFYIDAAIGSVLTQTESDLELIVINDGSTDDTLERAKAWAVRDSRVRVITQPCSGRPGSARNVGLEGATGKYVSFLDSDDLYHADKLGRALRILEGNPEIRVLFHDMYMFEEVFHGDGHDAPAMESYLGDEFVQTAKDYLKARGDGLYLCNDRFFAFMAFNFAGLHTDTVIIRRDDIEKLDLRFAQDVAIGEDTEFWYRLGRSLSIAYLDQKLSFYRKHAGGITRNRERWFRDLLTVYVRNYKAVASRMTARERAAVRRRISAHCFSEGYFEWTRADPKMARDAYWRSLHWRPNAKAIAAILKTFVPGMASREK